ncbi:uncharacterized protein J3R85_003962 [Psidium guajava]|nr:uncharacterized protein J3R85_003962 [Psidium guajava]
MPPSLRCALPPSLAASQHCHRLCCRAASSLYLDTLRVPHTLVWLDLDRCTSSPPLSTSPTTIFVPSTLGLRPSHCLQHRSRRDGGGGAEARRLMQCKEERREEVDGENSGRR